MLDSIVFEQHGVPSASIITDVFIRTGDAMARTWGLKDFRFLNMPHPIANLSSEQLDQRAREIVPEVVRLLLEG
ncbi:MAG TPA: UGSC family (seleno)protein, partial [Burkholderiales bacterium]|nr:UGSC family (seleno)protein [Burkholderiales bacterium]